RFGFDGGPKSFCYFAGDVVLDHQYVVEGPVVRFGPDDVTVVGANQARVDAQPGARFADAAIEYIGNTERFGDLGDGDLRSPIRTRPQFALEIEGGRGRRYAKAGDFAEFVDEFFGHAVGEGLLVHVVGQVEKREYADGFLWL